MVHILFNTGGGARNRAAGPAPSRSGGASQGAQGATRPPRTAAR